LAGPSPLLLITHPTRANQLPNTKILINQGAEINKVSGNKEMRVRVRRVLKFLIFSLFWPDYSSMLDTLFETSGGAFSGRDQWASTL
jgi:hypothetical protein